MPEKRPNFKKWHKANLIELLQFIEYENKAYFIVMLDRYDEVKRGN